ncbi:hypothetical protein [Microbacterium sp. 1.5R]|uniref:hypothetical protein n=1 Tax=Microbacterium sp. 1.5R TaxID=1916917 RepID=UPI0011A5FCB2|nr:hypothetical protein [Microbacterium sp. 1.5R]
MTLALIGFTLFAVGVVVERAGRKLGTVLALLPVVLWFAYLAHIQLVGELGERESVDLMVALVVGLLSFSAGQVVAGVVSGWVHGRRNDSRQ